MLSLISGQSLANTVVLKGWGASPGKTAFRFIPRSKKKIILVMKQISYEQYVIYYLSVYYLLRFFKFSSFCLKKINISLTC